MAVLAEQQLPYVRLQRGYTSNFPVSAPQYLSTVAVLGTAAVQSFDPTIASTFSLAPIQNMTINATSVPKGQELFIVVTTTSTTSYTLTFGALFRTQGVLSTGAVSGKIFTIDFISDGVNLNEVSRSIAM